VAGAAGSHHLLVRHLDAHQRRDAYWQRGSVCEDFSKITIPVYAISGWDDTYSNAVPRLMQGCRGPRKGLIGPWSHAYPFLGDPGPAIGYLQEAIRWWRHWLEGTDTGIMDEPVYTTWINEPHLPAPSYPDHPGRWVGDPRMALAECFACACFI
jgi:predicted acyl esterase